MAIPSLGRRQYCSLSIPLSVCLAIVSEEWGERDYTGVYYLEN